MPKKEIRMMFWRPAADPSGLVGSAESVDAYDRDVVIQNLKSGKVFTPRKVSHICKLCGESLGEADLGMELNGMWFIWPEQAEHYIEEHKMWVPELAEFLRLLS